jgi:hypothetical protein
MLSIAKLKMMWYAIKNEWWMMNDEGGNHHRESSRNQMLKGG